MLGVLDAHYSAERIRVPVHLLSRLRARCFFAILRPKRPHESRPANPSASKAAIHAICTRARASAPDLIRAIIVAGDFPINRLHDPTYACGPYFYRKLQNVHAII